MTVECEGQSPRTSLAELEPAVLSRLEAALAPSADRGDVQRVVVFATVSLALLMMSVDSTIVATALHALQHGLHTTVNWAGWTITAYAFGYVLMVPISGKLSNRLGRRRVFLASALVFTVASLLCGLADNVYLLIALRALQAAGGAGFTPSATGIVVDHFGDQRDRAVGLFGSIFPIGGMIGPIFGGLFVSYWSWRGTFLVNVPIGLLLIVLCLRYIPRDSPLAAGARGTLDWVGMALLGVAVLGGMLAVTHLGERGASLDSALFVVPLALALASALLCLRHLQRTREPFIRPQLIYGPGFGPVNLLNSVFGGTVVAVIALLPLYGANRYGLHALSSGTLLVAEGVASIGLSVLATVALRRTGYRPPLYVACVVIAIGILMLAMRPLGLGAYAWLALGAFVLGVGDGIGDPAGRNAGLQMAPQASSMLAAVRSMCFQIGEITTISLATAIIAGSGDSGMAQAWIFVALAVIVIAALPLIRLIPEHHGSW